MNNQVNIEALSNYIISYCQITGVSITPLKLQKLLYYIQAWHITLLEKNTLFEELPEAWVNGPVYRSVYHRYKSKFFKNESIKGFSNQEMKRHINSSLNNLQVSQNQMNLINDVLKAYSKFGDDRLVMMTHSEAPWNEARKGLSLLERSENKLDIEIMYDYFNRMIKK